MASTYKLYYFDAAGRGAIIRHLFAYGNQSFEDIRIPKDQWPEYKNKTPFGQLPVLEIDGQQVAQSRAIARYLAKKFNLVGKNDLEALKCDELIDTIEDFLQKGLKYFLENDPAQKEIHRKKFFEEDIPYYLEKFEAIVSKNGGYTVGSQLTWSDFQFAGTLAELEKHHAGLLKPYPALSGLIDKVSNLPSIKAWREKSEQKK